MNRAITTLAAGAVTIGLAGAVPTTANANPIILAPVAAAAILGGGVLGGAMIGSAAANNNATFVAAQGPGVTINGTTCYYTNRLVNPVTQSWVREQVCTMPTQ